MGGRTKQWRPSSRRNPHSGPWRLVSTAVRSCPASLKQGGNRGSGNWLMARGYNIDLGLGQSIPRTLAKTGLTVEDAFERCKEPGGGGVDPALELSGRWKVPGSKPRLHAALCRPTTPGLSPRLSTGMCRRS